MIIQFPLNDNPYNQKKLWYAEKLRPSSMTGVTLLEPDLLVCSSYWMREIYLVKFDDEKYEILDKQSTLSNNKPTQTELLDSFKTLDGYKVIASNFSNHPLSCYEVKNNKIKFLNSFPNIELGICHGVKIYSHDKIFAAVSGCSNPNKGIYGFKDSVSKPYFHLIHNWLCKDLGFLDDSRMVVLTCSSAPNENQKRIYDTALEVYDITKNSKIIDRIEFKNTHADSIKIVNNDIFVTVEEVETNGSVWKFKFDSKLHFIEKIGQYSFPHGIDVKFGLIAVTEYGNSTVVISKI